MKNVCKQDIIIKMSKGKEQIVGENLRECLFEKVILTLMHSRTLKEEDALAEPTTLLNEHVCLRHARKQHRKEISVIGEQCKVNMLQLFNIGIADDGAIDRTKKISPIKAMKLLKKTVIDE